VAAAGVTPSPTYNYTVNGTDPAWFYCKTGTHCKSGMVFAVNPTAERTFDAFKATAQGGGTGNATASSAPSGTASGSTAPAATSKAAANGRSSVGVGAVAAALLFGGMSAL
jgi:hypothetical protein